MQSSQTYRSRWLWRLGAMAATSLIVPAALAGPPAADDKGLMTYPNVRVVNAPITTPAAASSAKSEGMRAAIDPETGRLRQVTAEDAAALTPSKAKSAARGAQRTATATGEPEAGETIYGPGNAVGVTLGDDAMVYQVVTKSAEGLEVKEVNGKRAANHAVDAASPQSKQNSQKEAAHAHK